MGEFGGEADGGVKQNVERADVWPRWQDHGLVFPSSLGTPKEPDNLRRSWGRIRAAAGLGSMPLHDMRHTCVSLLLDLGVPPHIVREIVGHSDVEVTMTSTRTRLSTRSARPSASSGMPSADSLSTTAPDLRPGPFMRLRAGWGRSRVGGCGTCPCLLRWGRCVVGEG
ncbi:tyrosine-type recombinase/integrase [Actinomadura nitritigenes]|uniref:tyrosine-type recombinase/integrase n=1 Tax=Actinomadura nitritigenes TaxID=134602 RepID=UPI003D9463BB